MTPRGKLYISYKDVFAGIFYCLTNRFKSADKFVFEKNSNELICLSVRTGFDLVLSALKFPANAEVLVTNINIPDMFKIITAHGLIPVPLAVNKHTLNLSPAQVEACITPATKAILITHLFGAIMETDEIVALAKKYNLIVFEDCAQAYAGSLYQGNEVSDIVMLSFGLIKTNTAVNGAIIKIKSPALYMEAALRYQQYPSKSTAGYLKKLLKVFIIKLLTNKSIYYLFYRIVKAMGKDFDDVLGGFTKGFPGDEIFKLIRYRPCLPNKKLLQRKIRNFDPQQITLRVKLAESILAKIPEQNKVGSLNARHTHWVMPIETDNPNRLVEYLRSHGFDASQKASSLIKFKHPGAIPHFEELVLANLVYLPVYPTMGEKDQCILALLLEAYLLV